MPFQSTAQAAKCFATHGFGNHVNCKEWAAKTDYKNLPKHKKKSKEGIGLHSKAMKHE